MLTFLAKRAIDAFERRWNYDHTYAREILQRAGFRAIQPLDALGRVSKYRRAVPAPMYYAAKITATIAADCGSCAQLAVTMARHEGVAPRVLRALAEGDREALGSDERLGYDLARATLAREPADDVRRAIVERYGYGALVSLAYALVAAQAFPTLKYALGYGSA